MSADLFRREALEYRTRQRGPGPVLRVGTPWVRWLYWIVLALVVAGLTVALLVRVERTASGPALIDPQDRTFAAVLPAVAGSDLRPGHPLELQVDAPTRRVDVAATALRAEVAEDGAIRPAGFDSFPQPAVLVTGGLSPDVGDLAETSSTPRLTGRAVTGLGSTQALTLFLRGFQGAPGGGDG